MRRMQSVVFFCTVALMVPLASAGSAVSILTPAPLTDSERELPALSAQQHSPDKPHLRRTGRVRLDVGQFFQAQESYPGRMATSASFLNQILSLGFFDEDEFLVEIHSQQRPNAHTYLLRGHLLEVGVPGISTFTMTVTESSYLISLQELRNGTLYRVRGDSATGLGQALEIDERQIGPQRCRAIRPTQPNLPTGAAE